MAILLFMAFSCWGCAGGRRMDGDELEAPSARQLATMRFTIQVGAFTNMDNAVRLTDALQAQGVNAFHFLHPSGLYKVRFGNYATKDGARRRAEALKKAGVLAVYYIVGPEDYSPSIYRPEAESEADLRDAIVGTANQYIGVPYQWGGVSARTGFDCSGLAMVVYRLNGLQLPRSSGQQWQSGRPVGRSRLQRGGLVFFATSGGRRVSHVGIYAGSDKFLHAPGQGRKIRISSLSSRYYKSRYLGARSYL
jgi:cell wall-associated NlpC family hydrolase